MTETIKTFEEFSSLPVNLWWPLFDLLQKSQLTIEHWQPEMAAEIYQQLEHPNWAPWLEASQQTIAGRAEVFPMGQLLIKDSGMMAASLSLNQINWNGDPDSLPTWDQVAGLETTDYSETYVPDGNTLVLMSMNVAPEAKGQQLPSKMIQYVKLLAQQLGVEHVIGSFRPSGFGQYKKTFGHDYPFWSYCLDKKLSKGQAAPIDPWLRSLWWNGMQLLKEDSQAMKVSLPLSEFAAYQIAYQPESWEEVMPGIWECGEVGCWTVDGDLATYQEANAWGQIPLK